VLSKNIKVSIIVARRMQNNKLDFHFKNKVLTENLNYFCYFEFSFGVVHLLRSLFRGEGGSEIL